jgi:hypothetical protein
VATGSIKLESLFRTLPTRVLTGQAIIPDYSTPQGKKDLRTLFMGLSRETRLYKLPLGAR